MLWTMFGRVRRRTTTAQSRPKIEIFFTVTACHRGCREDTKSSLPDGVASTRCKFVCLYRNKNHAS